LGVVHLKQAVVLVHGVLMTGLEMQLLAVRLRQCGFPLVKIFHYRSLRRTPAENAQALKRFIEALDADVVHLVGHSLGGIVIAHLFDSFPEQPPGKVVMLGTPLNGSATAVALRRLKLDGLLLGRSMVQGLLGDGPRWKNGRELAMVAGNRGLGVGMLFGQLSSPNDGTVAVSETRAPEVTQHLQVPYSHFGLLFARPVATAICAYLSRGEFVW